MSQTTPTKHENGLTRETETHKCGNETEIKTGVWDNDKNDTNKKSVENRGGNSKESPKDENKTHNLKLREKWPNLDFNIWYLILIKKYIDNH